MPPKASPPLDATIAGYAHEAGRSVIILVNKWDAVTIHRTDGKAAAILSVFEEQVRDHLKFLAYAPVIFTSGVTGYNTEKIFETSHSSRASAANASAPAR